VLARELKAAVRRHTRVCELTSAGDPLFRSTVVAVEVLSSAYRHGVRDSDIQHALRHAQAVDEVGEDPVRYLVLGPDAAGNVLELVVLDRPDGPAVIHAMPMRRPYRRLLPGAPRP